MLVFVLSNEDGRKIVSHNEQVSFTLASGVVLDVADVILFCRVSIMQSKSCRREIAECDLAQPINNILALAIDVFWCNVEPFNERGV